MKRNWKVYFYETKNGKCTVREFLDSLSNKHRRKVLSFIEYLKTMGINLPRPIADFLRDGIHELRVKLTGEETRILYFFCYKEYIILTHSFTKTANQISDKEIEKAIKYKNNFLNRYNVNNIKEIEK